MWIEVSKDRDGIEYNKLLINISQVKAIKPSTINSNTLYVDDMSLEFNTAEDMEKVYARLFEACYNESMVKI